MMAQKTITRRVFLHIVVGLSSLGLTLPARILSSLVGQRAPESLAANLAKVFAHKKSAALVGVEYLRSVPREADARMLVDLICSREAELRATLIKADLKALRELLRHQQRQDFEQGRIVKLQGWILSETEARLCALAAIV